jgi:hypothetical protein
VELPARHEPTPGGSAPRPLTTLAPMAGLAGVVAAVGLARRRRDARPGNRTRRSSGPGLVRLATTGVAGGYLLGARAGRERYDQICRAAAEVADRSELQRVAVAVADPERRELVATALRQETWSLVEWARGEAEGRTR